jgi:hypothetical protein
MAMATAMSMSMARRLRAPRRHPVAIVLLAAGLAAVAACGDDAPEETRVTWIDPPPATANVGQTLTATFRVTTPGTLHVAILRGCRGEVPDCGLAGFDAEGYADIEIDPMTAGLTPTEPGTWSVAVYAHVDEDPHLSEVMTVDVKP